MLTRNTRLGAIIDPEAHLIPGQVPWLHPIDRGVLGLHEHQGRLRIIADLSQTPRLAMSGKEGPRSDHGDEAREPSPSALRMARAEVARRPHGVEFAIARAIPGFVEPEL